MVINSRLPNGNYLWMKGQLPELRGKLRSLLLDIGGVDSHHRKEIRKPFRERHGSPTTL